VLEWKEIYKKVQRGREGERERSTHEKNHRSHHPRVRPRVRVYAHTHIGARRFCNMLLFGSSEYLRDRFHPSAIVVALTDIDNPQEKLAGYLEFRIFPGYASALENRSYSWVGLNSFLVSSSSFMHDREPWLLHRMRRPSRGLGFVFSISRMYIIKLRIYLRFLQIT